MASLLTGNPTVQPLTSGYWRKWRAETFGPCHSSQLTFALCTCAGDGQSCSSLQMCSLPEVENMCQESGPCAQALVLHDGVCWPAPEEAHPSDTGESGGGRGRDVHSLGRGMLSGPWALTCLELQPLTPGFQSLCSLFSRAFLGEVGLSKRPTV